MNKTITTVQMFRFAEGTVAAEIATTVYDIEQSGQEYNKETEITILDISPTLCMYSNAELIKMIIKKLKKEDYEN